MKLTDAVKGFANEHETDIQFERGTGRIIGRNRREERAAAFRTIVAAYEARHGIRSKDDREDRPDEVHGDRGWRSSQEWRLGAIARLEALENLLTLVSKWVE
jgi:hypothetical protein